MSEEDLEVLITLDDPEDPDKEVDFEWFSSSAEHAGCASRPPSVVSVTNRLSC